MFCILFCGCKCQSTCLVCTLLAFLMHLHCLFMHLILYTHQIKCTVHLAWWWSSWLTFSPCWECFSLIQCQPAVVYTAPEYLVHCCCRVQLYCAHAADTTLPSRYRNFVNWISLFQKLKQLLPPTLVSEVACLSALKRLLLPKSNRLDIYIIKCMNLMINFQLLNRNKCTKSDGRIVQLG